TIENSYDRVSRDLKRLGQKSEFFWLVARSDPTRIPVSVTRRADGVTVINGVAQRPKGGPTVGQTIRGARSLVKRSGGDPTVSPAIGEARSLAPRLGGPDRKPSALVWRALQKVLNHCEDSPELHDGPESAT